jgi:DNA helicase II / ATP-dependent DNA helicase PcrA
MKFIADLHIHSHFSRATSKTLTPEYLDYHAGLKGIKIVGTGDFTHPGWLAELKEKTEPDGNGLFKLKKEYRSIHPLATTKHGFCSRQKSAIFTNAEGKFAKCTTWCWPRDLKKLKK